MNRFAPSLAFVMAWLCGTSLSAQAQPPVDAVTFAAEPGRLYLPLAVVVENLQWRVQQKRDGRIESLNGARLLASDTRNVQSLPWLAVDALARAGAEVTLDERAGGLWVRSGRQGFLARRGAQRVEIDLARQRLYAWQGPWLVLDTKISSGRYGNTPRGDFTAGPYKSRMHYSSRYNNAPMPWSVQVTGHIFIHGFSSVPDYPASHGCIRMPLNGINPARWFYEWVEVGTPIRIAGALNEEVRRAQVAN
jgi:hypothetical protein